MTRRPISLAPRQVSPANADAILAARAAGLKVFLATGRARSGPWVEECLVPHSLEAPGVFTQGLTSFDEGNRRVHGPTLTLSLSQRRKPNSKPKPEPKPTCSA